MATEDLLPNGAGTTTNLTLSGCSSNYQCVDDAVGSPDDDSTYVFTDADMSWVKDTYAITNSGVGAGTITNVRVTFRGKETGTFPDGRGRAVVRTNSTDYSGSDQNFTTSYANYTEDWANNPNTSSAWTWSEIDALEAGVELYRQGGFFQPESRCTQVYVTVTYTPAAGGDEVKDVITGGGIIPYPR